jgi:signal transduction histidine kinase
VNGLFHLLIGSLVLGFSLLILRANPQRWDNRAFALLGALDAAVALFRGVALVHGVDLADRSVMWPCAAMSPLLAWWSLEFTYSFPFSRPMPWRWRAPLLAATAAAVTLVAGFADRPWATPVAEVAFFIPMMLVMVRLAWRSLRRHTGDRFGVRLVLFAILFRWISANALYSVYPVIDAETWAMLLWVESTVVVLVSVMLISFANIRSNLFTMRSALGELAIESAFVMAGLLLTEVAVEAALRLATSWPRVERPLLMLATLVPLGVYVIAARLRPRLEASVDPRRAHRRGVLDRALREDHGTPDALIAAALAALREVSGGGDARFIPAAELDGGAAARAATAPGLVRVPVQHGRHVDGVLEVRGGVVDRETAESASLLAGRIALAFEHRRLVGELDESRRLAELGSFAAAIAHDIRTPLTSVQMNVQILRGKASLPPDDMEYFEIALDELRRLDGHVRELLDYAKPLQLHREPIEVRDLTDDAVRTLEPILAARGLRLWCEHGRDVPTVSCDPRRMKQVLWNLLDNAAKASPAGATIALHTRRDGPRVAIDVVDRGAGIAATDLARIFEPFFTTRPDGTGLGLAICQKVVKAHAGEIRVHSEPAQGSTFTVLLPA